jgi:predicted glutamine amidotransferase
VNDEDELPSSINADGFGIGWYSPEVNKTPCVFRSTQPIWSNRNLTNLASKVRSPLIFAHIRAATPGSSITEDNCHPFRFGRFLWMQ